MDTTFTKEQWKEKVAENLPRPTAVWKRVQEILPEETKRELGDPGCVDKAIAVELARLGDLHNEQRAAPVSPQEIEAESLAIATRLLSHDLNSIQPEILADMAFANEQLAKGAFDDRTEKYVAILNGEIVGYGNSEELLREQLAKQKKVLPGRFVVKHIGPWD